MIKTKHLLYAFKSPDKNTTYHYWYETDQKYFQGSKPPKRIFETLDTQRANPTAENQIVNPWND